MDFTRFWTLFQPDKEYESRRVAAECEWDKCSPNKRQAIIAWLETHGRYKGRNPYFFIQDFKPRQQTMSFADYYAKFGTTEERDGWKMANPTGNKVIYVKG